ncbi:hypothetical protein EYF80_049095 [Liparis tanakae]|uniref:Uncharacterized protein n=1 Tax=Liparis tanakae TaxID=230148 RepID=A0A4Z2FHP4_9TELE|nr:hypothetical protein EYF80_049095 [Liparis tanakae]
MEGGMNSPDGPSSLLLPRPCGCSNRAAVDRGGFSAAACRNSSTAPSERPVVTVHGAWAWAGCVMPLDAEMFLTMFL